MKNLLEKLKPEILRELDDCTDKFPSVIKEIKDELESLYYVSDIKYGTIVQLETYFLSAFSKFPKNGWENFLND